MHLTFDSAILFAADIALKATALFVATAVLMLLLRRSSAAARHLVGTVGLGAALLLPILSLTPARISLPFLPDVRPRVEAAPATADETPSPSSAAEADAWWLRLANAVPEKSVGAPQETPGVPSAAERVRIAPALVGVALALSLWLVGTLLVAGRLLVGWMRVRRIADGAQPIRDADWILERDALALRLEVGRRVELMESPWVPVAMTAGWRKPLLLIGRAARLWAVERRRVVLLHELAHVKRSDWASVLVAELAVAVYWFHPIAWWLGRRVRRDAERASDDLVISAGIKPSVYAGHLLGIFRAMPSPAHPVAPALAAVRPSHFEERLRAILEPRAPRLWQPSGSPRWAIAGLLAAAVGVTVIEPWTPSPASAAQASCPSAAAQRASSSERASEGLMLPATAIADETEGSLDSDSGDAISEADAVVHAIRVDEEAPMRSGFVRASNGERKRDRSDWYERGMRLHRDERYPEAIEAFQKAIEAGDREDAASYNIACGYALMGNLDEAFQWLKRARDWGFDLAEYIGRDDDLDNLRSDARWAELKKWAGSQKVEVNATRGRYLVTRYERLVAKAPKSGKSFFDVGGDLLHAEQYDLAAKAYQAAVDRGYRTGTALYNQACALSLSGQGDAALERLTQALDAGFDQPDLFRTDEDLDAIRDDPRFGALARDARDLSLPDHDRGWWHARNSRSDWREAVKRYDEYARRNPRKGRAWFNLGFASLAAERPDDAADAFRKALELGYRKPTTMYNLACSYSQLDQTDVAFEWLFKALEAGFEDTDTLRRDEDLDNLRGDPRYRKALAIARASEKKDED